MAIKIQHSIRTLRLKVKTEGYAWQTIQRINAEFATRRKQCKKAKLRWRPNRGSKRALGAPSRR
jgi:hypothetical protein